MNKIVYKNIWKNPYIGILLFTIFMMFLCWIISIILPQARIVSPFNILHSHYSAEINLSFTINCIASAIISIILLPLSKHKQFLLVTVCVIFESIYILNSWPKYTLAWHLYRSGPISLLICTLTSLYLFVYYSIKDRPKAILILEVMGLSLAMPLFGSYTHLFMHGLNETTVYDLILFQADSFFGFQPSFFISGIICSNTFLFELMFIIYFYLPLWMLIAQAITYTNDKSENSVSQCPGIPAYSYIVISILGALCYCYVPAVGPYVFFGSEVFPMGICPSLPIEEIRTVNFDQQWPRNCMPSLHLSLILAAFWSVYNTRSCYKWIFLVLSFLTCCSAFYGGSHYAIDFLAAIPFTTFCLSITWNRVPLKARLITAVGSGIAFFSLIYLLKHHIVWLTNHIILYWAFMIATVITSIIGVIYMLNLFQKFQAVSTVNELST